MLRGGEGGEEGGSKEECFPRATGCLFLEAWRVSKEEGRGWVGVCRMRFGRKFFMAFFLAELCSVVGPGCKRDGLRGQGGVMIVELWGLLRRIQLLNRLRSLAKEQDLLSVILLLL